MTVVLAGIVAATAVLGVVGAARGAGEVVLAGRTRRRVAPAGPSHGASRVATTTVRAQLSRFLPVGANVRRRADRDLPLLLDQVTRHLRAGSSLSAAVASAARGRSGPGTGRLADELAAGAPLAVAVEAWRARAPTPARDLVASALSLASEAGGAVAVVLDGVNETLRERVALEREVAAVSSQARASAAVLVVAPVAFAALAAAADPRVAAVLVGSPTGWGCIAGGALLDVAGALWMARLVGRAR
jgi:tight adherence protein B